MANKDIIQDKLAALKKELVAGDENGSTMDVSLCYKLANDIERLYNVAKKVFNQSKK